MNFYETLYIVHPALEAGRLKDIILSLEESLKKFGGTILSIDLWGKKKLAYIIDKQKYGTYVQLQFKGEGNCTSSFGMDLEHNPNILSYLTTLINEYDVVEQENDLDTQIAGHSREVQKTNENSASRNDAVKTDDKPATEEKNIIDKNSKNVEEEEQENVDKTDTETEEE
jgi:small subunit ribosomal protein S6